MDVFIRVRLDISGHAEEAGTELSRLLDAGRNLMAWLHEDRGVSEASRGVFSRDPGVAYLEVQLPAGPDFAELANAMVAWLQARYPSGSITFEVRTSTTQEWLREQKRQDEGRVAYLRIGPDGHRSEALTGSVAAVGRDAAKGLREVLESLQLAAVGGIPRTESWGWGKWSSGRPTDSSSQATGFRRAAEEASASMMPITIYLSDEAIHEQVETAIEALLAAAGLQVEIRDDPISGSWFRRMLATIKQAAHSPAAREATLVAAHVADTRLVLAQDAAVTAALLQNLGPVLAALQPTKDAVIRAGALLIVKVDWAVNVFQLTAAQQATLDHQPQLARSPHEIIATLNLTPEDHKGDSHPELS